MKAQLLNLEWKRKNKTMITIVYELIMNFIKTTEYALSQL